MTLLFFLNILMVPMSSISKFWYRIEFWKWANLTIGSDNLGPHWDLGASFPLPYRWFLLSLVYMLSYTWWPRKNATLKINNFKKTRDRMKKLCALLCVKFFPQQDDTKIVNFDEGVLILWPFFWGNVIFKICPSISKVTIYVPKISIVWLPWVKCLLLLCKAEPAWIKRSIHYVILQRCNPGELLKEIPPYLKRDFWYKRSEFWKWHWLSKMALKSKRLHQNH